MKIIEFNRKETDNGLWKKVRLLLIPFIKFSRHDIFLQKIILQQFTTVYARDFAGVI